MSAEPRDDSDRIKPCANCGGEGVVSQIESPGHVDDGGYFIQCTNAMCGMSTVLMYACGEDPVPILMEKWNRRATPAPGAPGQEAAAVQAVAQETDRDWSKAQDWKGMDGATAFLLINRHSDGWGDVGAMMNARLAANADGEKPS